MKLGSGEASENARKLRWDHDVAQTGPGVKTELPLD